MGRRNVTYDRESGLRISEEVLTYADTANIDLKKYHKNTIVSNKKSKKKPLTINRRKEAKQDNFKI